MIVDSVFAFRPQYNDCWEYRIWLEADPDVAVRRDITHDITAEGIEEATRLHRGRYRVAERMYLAEVEPRALADIPQPIVSAPPRGREAGQHRHHRWYSHHPSNRPDVAG